MAMVLGGLCLATPARSEVAPMRLAPVVRIAETPDDIGQLLEIEKKFKRVAAETLQCVVGIQIGTARGSGVLVSEDGLVLTAGHVAVKSGEKAKFVDSNGKMYDGVSLGVFASADAGMMKISGDRKWPFVKLGQMDKLAAGDWCVAMGHPLGFRQGRPPVVRIGRILRIENRVIQTDCPLISGDSGGPLFDLDGHLIGINSRIGGMANMNFHVPVNIFQEFWERLKKGENWKDQLPERDDGKIKASFRKVVADVSKCVVQIRCNGKPTVLGTIVGPDGWILTKASELKGRMVVRLPDGRDLEARTVGVDSRFDLAMLKIDALDLPKIKWSMKDPSVGQWVAVPGTDKDPIAVGVVSLSRCVIPPTRGTLGITVGQTKNGIAIVTVLPKSPADQAGLKAKDMITHINGKPVKDQKTLMGLISRFRPGDVVKLTVKRGTETLVKSAKLGRIVTPATKQRDMLNSTAGGMSQRHDDFPVVLQHDCILHPSECGGPLVTLDGQAVGVNIARGGRTETYCIPTKALVLLMYDLMSGRRRPLTPEEEKAAAEEKKPDLNQEEKHKEEKKQSPPAKPKAEPKSKPDMPKSKEKPAPKAKTKPAPQKETKPQKKSSPKPEPKAKKKLAPKDEPKLKPEPDKKADAPKPAEDKKSSKENPKAKDSDKPKAEKKETEKANPDLTDKKPKENKDAPDSTKQPKENKDAPDSTRQPKENKEVPDSTPKEKTSPEPENNPPTTNSTETSGPQPTPVGEPFKI